MYTCSLMQSDMNNQHYSKAAAIRKAVAVASLIAWEMGTVAQPAFDNWVGLG